MQHKQAISEVDKSRLSEYFKGVLDTNDTYQLQSYCWYNMARHFGLRGGEVFAKLTKNDIVFERDSDGVEHVQAEIRLPKEEYRSLYRTKAESEPKTGSLASSCAALLPARGKLPAKQTSRQSDVALSKSFLQPPP